MEITQEQIDALKAIKNTNTLITLIQKYVQDDPKMALELLDELGTNMESLGGIDLSKLETLKGEDGKTPVFGEDYMTGEEIDGLERFIEENVATLGTTLSNRLSAFIVTAQDQVNSAVGDIKNGKDGKDGKDVTKKDIQDVIEQYKDELKGSPDSPLEIVEKIKKVNGAKKLGLNNIRGLPAIKKRVEQNSEDIVRLKEETIKEISIAASNSGGGGGSSTDPDAIHDNVPGEIAAVATKATPVSGDFILIEDSADANNKKKVSVGSLPTGASGEANTASNVGAEKQVFKQKTGVDLEFRTLKAGANITLTQNVDDIEIAASGGSGDMTAAVYDPTAVAGDAFDMDNMAEGTLNKILTVAERTILGNTSGTNTGDQDLSTYQVKPVEGAFVDGDKTKLDGIAAGATVNSTDAVLLARGNHTGTQVAATISDFDTEVANNTAVAANTAKNSYPAGDQTKMNFISVTQAVNLDTMESDIADKIEADSVDTLTNKTFDANGTGNSISNIDVADLADGTDGELITWDAAGAPDTVAAGTAGQVLTSNGAGAAPTFQASGGGSSTVYAFRTYMASNQNVSTSAAKVTFDTESFDEGSGFNTTTDRYEAPVTGYYHFDVSVRHNPTVSVCTLTCEFRVNGTAVENMGSLRSAWRTGFTTNGFNWSANLSLSANDYVEIYLTSNENSTTVLSGSTGSSFSGFKIN